jgi:putative restriction endonuclease
VNVYVYPTDSDWFRFLRNEPVLDEVNFWRPGGAQPFRQLVPGDLFLFRLGAPYNAIGGGGIYTHFSFAPLAQVWDAFGRKNGTADFETLLALIARYKSLSARPDEAASAIIGCIVLTAPVFLASHCWFPVPPEYRVHSPQGQRFPSGSSVAERLTEAFAEAVRCGGQGVVSELPTDPVRFAVVTIRQRLGQGGFSLIVGDAYGKRCAVSGERTYPVLEAAHIRPVHRGGTHRPDNGLLLRSDIHKLFDRGYVTVRPDATFSVSRKLAHDWHNGRTYYELDREPIRLPSDPELRPATALLEWHNEMIFKG